MSFDADKHCGAEKRGGGPCARPKGWGTQHPGQGRCKLHGGATPNHNKAADRERAVEAVRTLGLPVEIDPHDALLEEVYRAAGHVAWLGAQVAQLDPKHLTGGIAETVQLPGGERRIKAAAGISTLVKLYQEERDRLVRVSEAAIRAGVAERQVAIAEAQAQQLAAVVRGILMDLGHDLDDPGVRKVVRLRLIEGGRANGQEEAA